MGGARAVTIDCIFFFHGSWGGGGDYGGWLLWGSRGSNAAFGGCVHLMDERDFTGGGARRRNKKPSNHDEYNLLILFHVGFFFDWGGGRGFLVIWGEKGVGRK